MSDYPKAPCVGENVVWYPHGDLNQEPFAATIVGRLSDECVTLYTLSPTGRREPKINVRHINNETSEHALIRWGAWDLVGEHEKRVAAEQEAVEKERMLAPDRAVENITAIEEGDEPDENEMLIVNMAREMGDVPGRAQAIATKIGGGMTHQRVNATLRRFPKYLDGPLPLSMIEGN